ncbi:hypothetical protein ACP4OV_013310 [Aristida adscensionis]
MGKRQSRAEPSENHHLPGHWRPSTSTTPEPKRRKPRKPQDPAPDTGSGSVSGSDSDPLPPSSRGSVRDLLEPYSRPRLLAILAEAAAADPALRARLRAAAVASPSHRRLFVHGLPSHADGAALAAAFARFGPLVDCHAVADSATGRCKGYGFVSFASRAAARRALRCAPGVRVAGSPISAQFASAGPTDPSGTGGGSGGPGRRVYVTNVAPDDCADWLRAFFARFGELEGGPFGFDAETGRSRGYALFVYRAAGGAARAVEEPYRVFEGRTLHCQLARDPARKSKAPMPAAVSASAAVTPPASAVEAPALQPVLDAVVAAGVGNLAAYAQNPALAAALLGQNPILAAAALSSALASAAAAPRSPASAIAPSPAAASAPAAVPVAPARPVTAAEVVPPPVKVGARPNGGGLLGPYRPPSSPVVSSSSGRTGTMLGV